MDFVLLVNVMDCVLKVCEAHGIADLIDPALEPPDFTRIPKFSRETIEKIRGNSTFYGMHLSLNWNFVEITPGSGVQYTSNFAK